jgi:hypothetical protein
MDAFARLLPSDPVVSYPPICCGGCAVLDQPDWNHGQKELLTEPINDEKGAG